MPKQTRRRSRAPASNPRRRRSRWAKATNVPQLAVGLISASAITQMLFNVNLIEFATGTVAGKYHPGTDGTLNITLPELLGAGPGGLGGEYGKGWNFTKAVQTNVKANAPMAIGTIAGVTLTNGILKRLGVYKTMNKVVRVVPDVGRMVKF